MIKPNISVFKPQILLNKLADNIPTVPQTVENESLAIDTKLLNQLDEKDISKALKDSEATIAEIDSLIDKNGRPTPKLKEKIAGETITANEMASFKYEMTELRMKMEIASSRFKEALTAINDHKEERITSAVKSFMATAEVALQEQTYNETAALQDGLLIELGSYKVNDGTSGEKMKTLANELVSLPPVNPEMSTAELSMTKQHLEAIQNEALAVYENYEAGKVLLAKNREAYSKAVADLESKTSMFAFMTGDTHKDSALRYYKKGIEELGAPNADANTKEEQELYGKKIAVLSSSALAVEKGFDDEKARKSAVQLANNFHISERQKVNATALPDGFNKSKETARAKFSKLGLLPDNATVAQAKEYKGKIVEITKQFTTDAKSDRLAHSEHVKLQTAIAKAVEGKERVIKSTIKSPQILSFHQPADKFQKSRRKALTRMAALTAPTTHEEAKKYTQTVSKIANDFRNESKVDVKAYADATEVQKEANKAFNKAINKFAQLKYALSGTWGKIKPSNPLNRKYWEKLYTLEDSLYGNSPKIGDGQTAAKFAAIEGQIAKIEVGYNQEKMVEKIGGKGCANLAKVMKDYYEKGVVPTEAQVAEAAAKDKDALFETEFSSIGEQNEAKAAYKEAKKSLLASIRSEKMIAAAKEAGEKAVSKLLAGMKAISDRVEGYKIHEPQDETQVADAIDERMALLEDTKELDTMLAELDATSEFVSSDAQAEIAQARTDAVKGAQAQIAKATKAPKKKGNKNEYGDVKVTEDLLAFRDAIYGKPGSLFKGVSYPSMDLSLKPRERINRIDVATDRDL